MPLRPSGQVPSRPDHTVFVDEVARANGINSFTTRSGETLRFFSRFFMPESESFPWAGDPLPAGERVFLNRVSEASLQEGTVGQPLTFSNPLVIEDGVDFEIVQDYIDMRGNVELILWGTKPTATPPYNSESQFEPIAPVFYDGASGAFNVQRVAEPTKRSLLNPELEGTQAVAATVENVSGQPDPLKGKIYVAAVERGAEDG